MFLLVCFGTHGFHFLFTVEVPMKTSWLRRSNVGQSNGRNHRDSLAARSRRLRLEALEDRRLLSVFTVNSTADAIDLSDGVTTLREALDTANLMPNIGGPDVINFDIPTTDPGYNPTTGGFTIKPLSALPTVTDPVVIDGATQPSFVGTPLIELDGSAAPGANGLTISGGDSTVRGLAINRFAGYGLVLDTNGGNVIEASTIGAEMAGTAIGVFSSNGNRISNVDASWAGEGKSGYGIQMQSSSDNIIEGVIATNRNTGLRMIWGPSDNNTIQGNDFSGAGSFGIWSDYRETGQGNRYLNNDLSGTGGWALVIAQDTRFEVAGNDFSNSAYGIELVGMSGLVLGDSATPATAYLDADLSTVTGTALKLNVVSNSRISGLDLSMAGTSLEVLQSNGNRISNVDASWAGDGKVGTGILMAGSSDNIIEDIVATNRGTGLRIGGGWWGECNRNTIRGNDFSASAGGIYHGDETNGQGNQYLNNNLSATYTALSIWGDTQFVIAGNNFSNSGNGIGLTGMNGLVLDDSSTATAHLDADLSTVTGTALGLTAVSNSHISGLDLSWVGDGKSGTGIVLAGSSDNIIEDIVATNRGTGLRIGGGWWGECNRNTIRGNDFSASAGGIYHGDETNGQGNQYLNNNLSATYTALSIWGDTQFVIAGNNFSNSGNGIVLTGMNGLVLDDSAPTATAHLDADLSTVTGTALDLTLVSNSHVSGLDLSWAGGGRSGTGIVLVGSSDNIIEGVVATNRNVGLEMLGTGWWGENFNNTIRKNDFSNTGLGIDLGRDGATPNDLLDADVGPNNLQNYPVLSGFEAGANTRVQGSLNSLANTTFALDFYANTTADPAGHEGGQRWLGSTTVTTNASGDASFDVLLTGATTASETVTATATDLDGNTSEFSLERVVNRPPVATNDAYSMYGEGIIIAASDLLTNDSDPDGDPLGVVLFDGPSEGTLTDNGDGTYTYTVGTGFDGLDSFTYMANDGIVSGNLASVTITHMLYVRNTNDGGDGSLRWAIGNANLHSRARHHPVCHSRHRPRLCRRRLGAVRRRHRPRRVCDPPPIGIAISNGGRNHDRRPHAGGFRWRHQPVRARDRLGWEPSGWSTMAGLAVRKRLIDPLQQQQRLRPEHSAVQRRRDRLRGRGERQRNRGLLHWHRRHRDDGPRKQNDRSWILGGKASNTT